MSDFKACSCGTVWCKRDQFLSDPGVEVIGYIAYPKNLKQGVFCFNHNSCRTTMGILAEQFLDMYHGPIYEEPLRGTTHCPGYCLHKNELRGCPNKCECAYVREVLQIVKAWPKTVPRPE